eukprot:TRINITY_DN934_c0_g1_i2.p2 TRINITY_DN934_c0_g1~~TRINITY_DN934_c0_g1_i2.p2  ORF type:complete len:171 (+),score=37.15 TRINITY_DN934_c0_g1_i2:710-1222(+)
MPTASTASQLEADRLDQARGITFLCFFRKEYSADYIKETVFADEIPTCTCGGFVKPDIVFFGEGLPRRFFQCMKSDFDGCDLLIVIGTSLKVYPFAHLVGMTNSGVPRLLINMELVGEFEEPKNVTDVSMLGDCQAKIQEFTELLGWEKELEELAKTEQDEKKGETSKTE